MKKSDSILHGLHRPETQEASQLQTRNRKGEPAMLSCQNIDFQANPLYRNAGEQMCSSHNQCTLIPLGFLLPTFNVEGSQGLAVIESIMLCKYFTINCVLGLLGLFLLKHTKKIVLFALGGVKEKMLSVNIAS